MRDKAHLELDNTLRFLYSSFRYIKGLSVAIEFKHNGRIWRADTAEEAIELRNRLEGDGLFDAGTAMQYAESASWTPDAVTGLLESVGKLQKEFLKFLFENFERSSLLGIESSEIIKALKLRSEEALAGVLSGLSKHLKKLDMRPDDLYVVRVKWTKDGKIRNFHLKGNFKATAEELGWPEKWI